MLKNDGHVRGEGGAGYPSSFCFDQRHYSFHLCIPQCPHLEGSSTHFFLYLHALNVCGFFFLLNHRLWYFRIFYDKEAL